MKKLAFLDPYLRGMHGHNVPYAKSIFEETKARKKEFHLFGCSVMEPSVRDILPTKPLLRMAQKPERRGRGSFQRLFTTLAKNWVCYRDIHAGLQDISENSLLVVVPNATQRDMLAYGAWLVRQPKRRAPKLVLLFRWSNFSVSRRRWENRAAFYRMSFRFLEWVSRRRKIFLATDSERLADEYSKLTRLRISVLPIPHTHQSITNTNRDVVRPHFVFVGRTNSSQGIEILVQALSLLREDLANGTFSAFIQSNPQADDSPAVEACSKLDRLELPNVTLWKGFLSEREYHETLSNADVILLPYSREVYYAGTSGICAEALAMGIPIITTQDTWMSDQVARGGGLTFRDSDATDLARAIREAVRRAGELKVGARKIQAFWRNFHNPENFYEQLVALAFEGHRLEP